MDLCMNELCVEWRQLNSRISAIQDQVRAEGRRRPASVRSRGVPPLCLCAERGIIPSIDRRNPRPSLPRGRPPRGGYRHQPREESPVRWELPVIRLERVTVPVAGAPSVPVEVASSAPRSPPLTTPPPSSPAPSPPPSSPTPSPPASPPASPQASHPASPPATPQPSTPPATPSPASTIAVTPPPTAPRRSPQPTSPLSPSSPVSSSSSASASASPPQPFELDITPPCTPPVTLPVTPPPVAPHSPIVSGDVIQSPPVLHIPSPPETFDDSYHSYTPNIPMAAESSSRIPSPQPLPTPTPQPLPPNVKPLPPKKFIPPVLLHSSVEPPASDQRTLDALRMVASLRKRRKLTPKIVPRAPRPSPSRSSPSPSPST
ncbi:hypothetical protein V9T40_007808 [Parthenolecanium corni]|uniref:Uncharacterized protein n=1 Tax=Parthenolecanium corni TaxID=536013 RepID=A0AAN9TMD3_9HEMI